MERWMTGRGRHAVLAGMVAAVVAAAAGCKEEEEPSYRIGGTVTGLSGEKLTLTTSGQSMLVSQGATTFQFPRKVPDGTAYDVKVALQSTVGICTVSGGAGTVAGADVSVSVNCSGTMGWALTAPMATGRTEAVVEVLPSSEVLVAGGITTGRGASGSYVPTDVTESYSPATDAWEATAPLPVNSGASCCIRLPSGKLYVFGGLTYDSQTGYANLDVAQIYDPDTGGWTTLDERMMQARSWHECTLLDSSLILITGGNPGPAATAELFDPSTGAFAPTDAMALPRSSHTLTKLHSGKVLVTGGCFDGSGSCQDASAELYDPTTGHWEPAGELPANVFDANATLLADGKVLVTGGCRDPSVCTPDGEGGPAENTATLYDPATNGWTDTSPMNRPRVGHGAILLSTGDVLVFGGVTQGYGEPWLDVGRLELPQYGEATEIYHPATGTWTYGPSMAVARSYTGLVHLEDGLWLVVGGTRASNRRWSEPQPTVQIFEE
jgi:N-acetylneuraminic acid mutarotase